MSDYYAMRELEKIKAAGTEVKAVFRVEGAIDKIADNENSRYSLANVLVTPCDEANVFLCATDGRRLVITKALGETDDAHYVPAKALNVKGRGKKPVDVCINGMLTVKKSGDEATTVYPIDREPGRFPPIMNVIEEMFVPDEDENGNDIEPEEGQDDVMAIHIDVKMLAEMAEAMNAGCDDDSKGGLILFVHKNYENAFVRVVSPSMGAIGLIGTLSNGDNKRYSTRRVFNHTVKRYRETFKQAAEYEEWMARREQEQAAREQAAKG